VENVADVCRRLNIPLIQISTDYVFDGTHGPYTETDTPNPINYYGRTKLAAENVCHRTPIAHAIIRTMWLYGDSEGGRSTFVDWTLKMLAGDNDFGVVTDEIGNPTITDDLAYAIIKILELKKRGTYHVAGPDLQSRWEFAEEIAEVFGYGDREIKPMTTHDLKRNAKRPLVSGLITLKAQTALGIQPTSTISGLTLLRTIMQRQMLTQPDRPC
jgi:dTDP-4-dehydrorhamnose reductase